MPCPVCNNPIPERKYYQLVYCSSRCRAFATLKGKRRTDYVACVCSWCNATFERTPSGVKNKKKLFCSNNCRRAEEDSRTITFVCARCGKVHKRPQSSIKTKGPYFCSLTCHNRYHTAHRHARWVGGTKRYRGPDWKAQRVKALQRDNHTCQHCGAQDHLVVHHKTPYRVGHDNSLKNLAVLCESCHLKADDAWRKANPIIQLRLPV